MALKRRFGLFMIITLLLGTFALQSAFSQKTVEFYSTISSSSDTDMISMTTNLFYTQMQVLDGYAVSDRRDKEFTGAEDFTADLAFFAEIQETEEGWLCSLNAIDRKTAKVVTESKTYASYYKILLDAKGSLESILKSIEIKANEISSEGTVEIDFEVSLDTLAGTWTGDTLIDKIVILRGGKGFVIFKNGASMNITVSLSGTSVTVTQKGRSNASFYPELSRELALKNAATASPIKWNLTILDQQTMKGIKTTLSEDKKSVTGASPKTIEVEWEKSVQ